MAGENTECINVHQYTRRGVVFYSALWVDRTGTTQFTLNTPTQTGARSALLSYVSDELSDMTKAELEHVRRFLGTDRPGDDRKAALYDAVRSDLDAVLYAGGA